MQALALVAYRHAVLTARALAGQSLPPVGEAFPFWTEEELLAARAEHYRSMMERLAGRWRGKERDNGQGKDGCRGRSAAQGAERKTQDGE